MKKIADVLAGAEIPPVPDPAAAPYMPDLALEQENASINPPVHPLIMAIAHRLGLMNVIRNRANQAVAAQQERLQ